ncbi:MAG: hypothetical protein JWN75_61 [Candidatus Saccharibacteria bacterium]|nr:hypothetical protein [Candidatus Saccharibacteria bacterium]
MNPTTCFFPAIPIFVNKRPGLVLPWYDHEIHPYVLDGYLYFNRPFFRMTNHEPKEIDHVDFGGFSGSFKHEPLVVPHECWGTPVDGLEKCEFEVIFELVPDPDRRYVHTRRADVLAISFDGCQTIIPNDDNKYYTQWNEEQAQVM